MEDIKLSLAQAGPSGELSIIRADGVIDTLTASELESVLESLLNQNKYKILVDLGGVEYISSAGWGIFVSKIQEIRDSGGDIKLINMIPNVYEIYELLEFEHIIQAFDTLEQGKKAFNLPTFDSGNGEKVWKTKDKVVAESGTHMQSAFSPGMQSQPGSSSHSLTETTFSSATDVIFRLVREDPFSSISELAHDANRLAPKYKFSWWKVFSILRKNDLLKRRSRFRLSRGK